MPQASTRLSWGTVLLSWDNRGITRLELGNSACGATERWQAVDQFGAIAQLQEYCSGKRKQFDLPLVYSGTAFQMMVWEALQQIPYGEVRSYSQLARAIDRPRAARAVGNANHNNPLPIFIPCHRVIHADGGIGGYATDIETKRFLLRLEKGCGSDR
jgi:O-6-methylguanine DNA methyltransferase